jgi:mono/diheme cytochrome c family protein
MRTKATGSPPKKQSRNLAAARFRLWILLWTLVPVLSVIVLGACNSGTGATAAPSPSPQSPRGQAVFARYCSSGHPGGRRGIGPSLVERLPTLSDEQVRATVRHGKNRMPGFGPKAISDDDLTELIAYVRTLK